MSAETKPRRSTGSDSSPAPVPVGSASLRTSTDRPLERRPFLLDFFPLEGPEQTRLSGFFDRLREGHLSTTRCPKDAVLHWPPRTACPTCHSEELTWVDQPDRGRIYAFSAVLGGAPLGMESEVPFAVGLIDLDGVPLRVFGRIEGRAWPELRIGGRVAVEPYDLGDGRCFYRFRALE